MGPKRVRRRSWPDLQQKAFLKRFFIILSLILVPGSIPMIAYSRARENGMSRTATLCITIGLLIIMFLAAAFTWAH